MKTVAIILAAGNGSRMKSDTKKQYIEVAGKPIIWHTIKVFEDSSVDEIILVTGKEDVFFCTELVNRSGFVKVDSVVAGGAQRYDSVYEGLKNVKGASYVLIHDGARPLVSCEVVEKCIEEVRCSRACIVAVPVKDTIKEVRDGKVINTPSRDLLWSVQTPQIFEYDLIMDAYKKMMDENCEGITDDSMVVEKFTDVEVAVIEGEYTNIKVTTPDDLITLEKNIKN